MELATAFVGIQLQDKGIAKDAAKAAKTAGDQAGKALEEGVTQGSKRATSTVKNDFQGLGTSLKGAFALTGVVLGLKSVIGAASDLNEEVSKSSVIFGSAAPAISAFAKGAEAIGQSQQQALQATSTFALFGKAAGLTGQQLVDFSTKADTLASDLASFSNTSPEQAIEAIGAAFRGESEPIRAYGVLLDDASLKQEALNQHLITSTSGVLPPAIRVQAAYGLILKQTKDAQGDFARTADGAANSSRVLAAQFENTKASLGTALLPSFQLLIQVASHLLGLFNSLPDPIKSVAVGLVAFAALRGPLSALGSTITVVGRALLSLTAANPALAALIGIVGAVAIIMQNSGDIVNEHAAAYKQFTTAVNDTSKAIGASFSSFRQQAIANDSIQQSAVRLGQSQNDLLRVLGDDSPGAIGRYVGGLKEAAGSNKEAQSSADHLQTALADIKWSEYIGAAAQFNAAVKVLGIEGLVQATRESGASEQSITALSHAFVDGATNATILSQTGIPLADTMDRVRNMMDAVTQAQNAAKSSGEGLIAVDDTANIALTNLDAAFQAAANAADVFKKKIDEVIGVHLDLDAAADATIAKLQAVTGSFKDNGITLDENTEKGRNNKDAIRESIDAELAYIDAFIKGGGTVADATTKVEQYRQNLVNQMVQSGFSREAAEQYIAQLGLTPENVDTAINLLHVEEEKERLQGWLNQLDKVPPEKKSEIQALIDQGKLAEAEAELNKAARNRDMTIFARVQLQNAVAVSGISAIGNAIPRAHGGPVLAGQLYRVNEYGPTRGPEFFVPREDGRILPLGSALSGSPAKVQQPTIVTNINAPIYGVDHFEMVMNERDRRLVAALGAG